MISTRPIFLFLFIISISQLHAQSSDSAKLANTLTDLLTICAKVDFADPKVQQLGTFYKAAPYIVYKGENSTRKWKDVTDYTKADEKVQVDETCFRINNSVNQDSSYKILKYLTQKESEGLWHVLIVGYTRKGVARKSAFAFLKINGKFALGDID